MTIPLAGQRVHFVGIGGAGMSGLARFLMARGVEVSGCDRTESELLAQLDILGVTVLVGHEAHHADGADVMVVSSALPSDTPELVAANSAGIPVVKRAQLLAEIMRTGRGIAVAGTHGKTTTSTLIAHILSQAGLNPTALVGGVSKNWDSNVLIGSDELIVVEADEYDASFHYLRPEIGLITNIGDDHLDYYGTREAVWSAFQKFASQVTGTLVVNADVADLSELVDKISAKAVTFGVTNADWTIGGHSISGEAQHFIIRSCGKEWQIATRLAGEHNQLNILGAVAVAAQLGVPLEVSSAAVATFEGVKRRQDRIGEVREILVIDDYAVHPTEVRATLSALHVQNPNAARHIRVLFQPHTYSRTHHQLHEFATSFEQAEAVYVLDIYAARETDDLGTSGKEVAAVIGDHHPNVTFTGSAEATVTAILADVEPGDVIVTMGAGDVTRLGPTILAGLSHR